VGRAIQLQLTAEQGFDATARERSAIVILELNTDALYPIAVTTWRRVSMYVLSLPKLRGPLIVASTYMECGVHATRLQYALPGRVSLVNSPCDNGRISVALANETDRMSNEC